MKKVLFFSAMIALLVACSSEKVNFSQLQDRNGLFYLVNAEKPFNGDVVSYQEGKLEFEGNIKNGLREGHWNYYFANGQKKSEGNYVSGAKDGTWTYYSENGVQSGVETYKEGVILGNQVVPEETGTGPQKPENTGGTSSPATGSASSSPKQKTVSETTSTPAPAPAPEKKQALEYHLLRGAAVKTYQGIPYTGAVVDYQPNGKKKFDGEFTNGRKTGKWTFYDIWGNPKETKFYSPEAKQEETKAANVSASNEALDYRLLHGASVKFYKGMPYTGKVVDYQPNGNKKFDGEFTNGRKTGKWTFYDIYGNAKTVKYY